MIFDRLLLLLGFEGLVVLEGVLFLVVNRFWHRQIRHNIGLNLRLIDLLTLPDPLKQLPRIKLRRLLLCPLLPARLRPHPVLIELRCKHAMEPSSAVVLSQPICVRYLLVGVILKQEFEVQVLHLIVIPRLLLQKLLLL